MNLGKPWKIGALATLITMTGAACGGAACPVGRTATENGTCVDQKVVDFVACIDHANGSDRSVSSGTKLSADVRAATVGVASAAEFQRQVSTRVYAGSDAQGQQILASCNAYVFGGGAQAYGPAGAPPSSPGWSAPGAVSPSPSSPAPVYPSSATTNASCGPTLAIPTDASWTLREREQWAQLARHTQGALDAAKDSCRAAIGGRFVFESFRGHFVATNLSGLDNAGVEHVRAPFNAVQQICDDGAMQQAAVRGRIQCVEVRYGGTGRSTWSLDGPVLRGTINPTGESDFDFRAQMRGPEGVRRAL